MDYWTDVDADQGTFTGLCFNQPHYFGELIHVIEPSRNLRSCHKDNLVLSVSIFNGHNNKRQ